VSASEVEREALSAVIGVEASDRFDPNASGDVGCVIAAIVGDEKNVSLTVGGLRQCCKPLAKDGGLVVSGYDDDGRYGTWRLDYGQLERPEARHHLNREAEGQQDQWRDN